MSSDIAKAIQESYQTKEPDQRDYFGSLEFELKGCPFHCSGFDSVKTKKLMNRILELLSEKGWQCFTSIDVMRKISDKSSFVFKKCTPKRIKVACVALSDVNHLKLIDFPENVTKILLQTIKAKYQLGVRDTFESVEPNCHYVDLKCMPWGQRSCDLLHGKCLMLQLLAKLESLGWMLSNSADTSSRYSTSGSKSHPMDVDSWFFYYEMEK